jgi:hypothetical protein
MITEKGDGVVLVLSAAVLVIVIDARAAEGRGWRAGGISRRRTGTEGLLASGDHEIDEVPRMGIGGDRRWDGFLEVTSRIV